MPNLMLNDLDRFLLVVHVIDRVEGPGSRTSALRQQSLGKRLRHRAYTRDVGNDPPDVHETPWPDPAARRRGMTRRRTSG